MAGFTGKQKREHRPALSFSSSEVYSGPNLTATGVLICLDSLLLVGVVHQLAEKAAEDVSAKSVAKVVLAFCEFRLIQAEPVMLCWNGLQSL